MQGRGIFNRFASWIRPAQGAFTQFQQRVELKEAQYKSQRLERQLKEANRLLESSSNFDYWLSSYVDLLDRYRDGQHLVYPVAQPQDHAYGRNFPLWTTETQLSLFRAQARLQVAMNPYARGFLEGLSSYVVGEGFTYRAVDKGADRKAARSKLAKAVQECIDRFIEENDWSSLEQELFWRSREDGEYFLRYFTDDATGYLIVRTVEPEQVSQRPETSEPEYSFGIHTDVEDIQDVLAYWVRYMAAPQYHDESGRNGDRDKTSTGEEVPAGAMCHLKVNVKRTIKRGLTDFFGSTYDALQTANRLSNNLGEGAAVQAAIAAIRQHATAAAGQVTNFTNAQVQFARTNPLTGQAVNYQQFEPGSIFDIPAGFSYVSPPGSAPGAAAAHIDILNAVLRKAGNRWNAPEWLATGSGADMAAYTASLTAESPFVKWCGRAQKFYGGSFLKTIKHAVRCAVKAGKLPPEAMNIIDVQVEAANMTVKDVLQETQANLIRKQAGVLSVQTWQQQDGLDSEQEFQNQEEFEERFGLGDALGLPPEQVPEVKPTTPDAKIGEGGNAKPSAQ